MLAGPSVLASTAAGTTTKTSTATSKADTGTTQPTFRHSSSTFAGYSSQLALEYIYVYSSRRQNTALNRDKNRQTERQTDKHYN